MIVLLVCGRAVPGIAPLVEPGAERGLHAVGVSPFRQRATAGHFDTSRANYCLPRLPLCAGVRSAIGNRAEFDSSSLATVLAANALRSFELELTKHAAADLAGERLRQVGDELDAPRVGIG